VITGCDYVVPVKGDQVYSPCDRAQAERFLAERGELVDFELRPSPSCLVCGAFSYDGTNRCWRHRDSTPCSIEGCAKSRKFKGYVADEGTWVCGVHWREVCPPRSLLRRTYLRFFRIARKLGVEKSRWPDDLEARYWRFFTGIVARHHRRMSGESFVDEAEINKLFGWEE
jgi:hypothetical protein